MHGLRTTKKRGGWRQWTPDEARRELAALQRSGLPLATYARQRGVSDQRLRWWRERLGEWEEAAPVNGPARWVPAVLRGMSAAPTLPAEGSAAVVVRLPGGCVLELLDAAAIPPAWVAELVGALAAGGG
ncbi:hypothetical protein [Myxococcus sp. SDU36]|uniref:IS66 family insertion sequence element accessory protein TnpA n=1 Tax=Myxococcus sp. SDU36 TaxID=2831967 RepID=UPI002542DC00|nr:hypothetical protein [Myxococcus sp. SDU36]WIG93417.1 hypothetical protein KGD87_22815 [Myxococcus sp. SDU36]WIG93732.1 hypothetical protein KGD87_24560 [Myxococcus sp. SDU36]WIG94594.1 hypothetical protein KGD87_29370 [Myxococcus sp. SDU36]WIG95394.1 hypothetical protein KGD87_33690 [Myxococcus sp. SDU36]WIG97583.1 hypothetical protein KGD87_09480 [Myxococcus sp. SDU36]